MTQGLELSEEQLARFITHLSASANVTASARAIGAARRTLYNWREKDETFAAAWAEALERGLDALEDECMRRAMEGVRKPVVSMGKIVMDPDTGKPLIEHAYSDGLAMFILKARRPGYRDRSTVDLNVGDLAELIAAGRKRARDDSP